MNGGMQSFFVSSELHLSFHSCLLQTIEFGYRSFNRVQQDLNTWNVWKLNMSFVSVNILIWSNCVAFDCVSYLILPTWLIRLSSLLCQHPVVNLHFSVIREYAKKYWKNTEKYSQKCISSKTFWNLSSKVEVNFV